MNKFVTKALFLIAGLFILPSAAQTQNTAPVISNVKVDPAKIALIAWPGAGDSEFVWQGEITFDLEDKEGDACAVYLSLNSPEGRFKYYWGAVRTTPGTGLTIGFFLAAASPLGDTVKILATAEDNSLLFPPRPTMPLGLPPHGLSILYEAGNNPRGTWSSTGGTAEAVSFVSQGVWSGLGESGYYYGDKLFSASGTPLFLISINFSDSILTLTDLSNSSTKTFRPKPQAGVVPTEITRLLKDSLWEDQNGNFFISTDFRDSTFSISANQNQGLDLKLAALDNLTGRLKGGVPVGVFLANIGNTQDSMFAAFTYSTFKDTVYFLLPTGAKTVVVKSTYAWVDSLVFPLMDSSLLGIVPPESLLIDSSAIPETTSVLGWIEKMDSVPIYDTTYMAPFVEPITPGMVLIKATQLEAELGPHKLRRTWEVSGVLDFLIDETEVSVTQIRKSAGSVSNSEWREIFESWNNSCHDIDSTIVPPEVICNSDPPFGKNFPATNVSWVMAAVYCNARSKNEGFDTVYNFSVLEKFSYYNAATGMGDSIVVPSVNVGVNGYRLPTEAEWELAANIGSNKQNWATVNGKAVEQYNGEFPANLGFSNPSLFDGYAGLAPIKTFAPSPWMIYEMTGNVWEWTHDYYLREPGKGDPASILVTQPYQPFGRLTPDSTWLNPTISSSPEMFIFKSIKGGSYKEADWTIVKNSAPNGAHPNKSFENIGFRTVRPAQPADYTFYQSAGKAFP